MKSGIDYFPLDVSLDAKLELIEAEFGVTGFGVVVHLLQEIYGKAGYYIEWTDEVALLFSRKVGLGGSAVSEIVGAAIRRGMFDQQIYDKYRVLTSRGVQKRYFEAVSRRKSLEVDRNILLVDPAQICPHVNILSKNVNIPAENVNISKQSKVEKSKVKKSKDREAQNRRFSPPSLDEVREYVISRGNKIDPEAFMDHYIANGWVQGREGKPLKDWKAAVRQWERRESEFGRPDKAMRGASDYGLAYK